MFYTLPQLSTGLHPNTNGQTNYLNQELEKILHGAWWKSLLPPGRILCLGSSTTIAPVLHHRPVSVFLLSGQYDNLVKTNTKSFWIILLLDSALLCTDTLWTPDFVSVSSDCLPFIRLLHVTSLVIWITCVIPVCWRSDPLPELLFLNCINCTIPIFPCLTIACFTCADLNKDIYWIAIMFASGSSIVKP